MFIFEPCEVKKATMSLVQCRASHRKADEEDTFARCHLAKASERHELRFLRKAGVMDNTDLSLPRKTHMCKFPGVPCNSSLCA
jgi:hypothetical protein